MFIELHILQSFVPSNLNRDDTNMPKDCTFGGVRRARISSQCLKRSMRLAPVFAKTTQVETGVRTRYLTRQLAQELAGSGKPDDQIQAVARRFMLAFSKMSAPDKTTPDRSNVLVYLSAGDIRFICEALLKDWESFWAIASVEIEPDTEDEAGKPKKMDKKKAKAEKNLFDDLANLLEKRMVGVSEAPDIAMFGRMLANRPDTNVDAAAQVAHAISTHAVKMDLDYFTAVDDMQMHDESGAGMIGTTAFNSACFYRYARLDVDQLTQNLQGDRPLAMRAVEAFLRAAVEAIPTGKQNSMAAYNPPDFVLAVTRDEGPAWNLANAFEKPVQVDRSGVGLLQPSICKLDDYLSRLAAFYGWNTVKSVAAATLSPDFSPTMLSQTLQDAMQTNLDAWIECAMAPLAAEAA